MCGIAGIVAWDEKYRITRATLQAMSNKIAHRGPDGEGFFLTRENEPITADTPQVGFAFRRLAILDPDPRSMQPFTIGHQTLVFNGEIYNFRELRSELSKLRPDYQWRTTGDTEVLLMSYQVWAEKCVEHLNGMFAFAVWDEREKALFVARDRMGQKPLYLSFAEPDPDLRSWEYSIECKRPQAVAFASELGTLRSVAWMNQELDCSGLNAFLSLGYIPDGSIYQDSWKLQPACKLAITGLLLRKQQYFAPFTSFTAKETRDSDARERTSELVSAAVQRQLVSDVPLGCFLSGGIDSSIIAAAMRRAVAPDQPVLTFNIGFDDPRYDETSEAAAVARHLGTNHHQFVVRPDATEDLPRLSRVFGEPFADSSALPTHYLARQTRPSVKVALSGDGGDELFGGYDRYRALAITEQIRVAGSAPVRFAASVAGKVVKDVHPKSRGARFKRILESAHLAPGDRYASYMRLFRVDVIRELLLNQTAELDSADQLSHMFDIGLRARPLVPNALAVDRVTYLPEDLLTKVDRCSMMHGLEVRSPFMDHELVQFAAGLTTDQLLKGGPKRMLREAFKDDLPAWVFKRKKMGFAVPIGEWFRDDPPLKAMLNDCLFARDSFGASHFNMNVVRRLVDEHMSERVDHSQRLYALLMLELWWRNQRNI